MRERLRTTGWLIVAAWTFGALGACFSKPADVDYDADPTSHDARAIDGPSAAIDGMPADGMPIDAGPIDAMLLDAMPPSVVLADVPVRIATSDTVGVTFTISGDASATIDWSIASGGGAFAPSSGTVATNGAGIGVISSSYTAPATAGDYAHVLTLTGAASADVPVQTTVRAMTAYGEASAFTDNNGQTVSANYLYGQAVAIASPQYVMRLDLITVAGGFNARMALYQDSGGVPGALVVASGLQGVNAGIDDFRVTPTMIAAGTYWIMLNADAAAPINRHPSTNTTQAYVALGTTAAMPASLTGVSTAPGRILNLYLQASP